MFRLAACKPLPILRKTSKVCPCRAGRLCYSYGMFNDSVIANKVREAILLNPRVSAQDIIVTCRNRVVLLAGEVDTPEQQRQAEETAIHVDGVVRVDNDLYVRAGRWPPAEMEVLPWVGGRPHGR